MEKNGQFLLMNRVEFKAWVESQKFTREITLVQQHHTYSPSYKGFTGKNHINLLNAMKNYHVNERGWSDIAQNITIFPDGKIAVCRPFDNAPAGINGANKTGICIENIGNFDAGADTMTAEHEESIIYVNAVLCMKYGLTPNENSIVYHHWYDLNTGVRIDDNTSGHSTKTCPGSYWFGGNTVIKAKVNFIPLIENKIAELKGKTSTPSIPTTTTAILRKGSKGSDVKTLQTKLNKLGYKLVVDGDFGSGTLDAVISFQNKNGLIADGIVGSNTWNTINKLAK